MGFEASVYDLAPTILHIYGIEQPTQMRGHVLARFSKTRTPKLRKSKPAVNPCQRSASHKCCRPFVEGHGFQPCRYDQEGRGFSRWLFSYLMIRRSWGALGHRFRRKPCRKHRNSTPNACLSHSAGKDALRLQQAAPKKLAALTKQLSKKHLTRRPAPGKWSIAEILADLADAELVIGWRMRLILGANGTPIQAFDQDVWAETFKYARRDPKTSLETFRMLRENNLRSLEVRSKEFMAELRYAPGTWAGEPWTTLCA